MVCPPPHHSLFWAIALGGGLWWNPANAGFDATGSAAPTVSEDPLDPMVMWRATRAARGAFGFSVLFEAAAAPLVRTTLDPLTGDPGQREEVLTDLAGFTVGGRYAFSDRFELAFSMPMWLSATHRGDPGGGLGDLRLHAPLGLAEGRSAGLDLGASVVPWVTLPTGSSSRYLGDPGPGLGAHLVGEAVVGPVIGLGWVGPSWRAFPAEDNVRPGPGLSGGATAGVVIGQRLGVHLGWRFDGRLVAADVAPALAGAPRRATGSEISLTSRARLGEVGWAGLGLATATQVGPGAADLRLWLGGGARFGGAAERVVTEAPVEVQVRDPRGEPVPGAVVYVADQRLGATDARGRLTLAPRRWRRGEQLSVRAPGYLAEAAPPPASDEPLQIALSWRPTTVTARVQTVEGSALSAEIEVVDAAGAAVAPARTEPGAAAFQLAPGAWTVQADASGYGRQLRTLDLQVGGPSSEEVTFILLPDRGEGSLDVTLRDVADAPVVGAEVRLEGQPIGASASGGGVWVGGLGGAPTLLDVQADTFRDLRREAVEPSVDGTPVDLVLGRQRGAVQVVVRGPDGERVSDADVRFVGADRIGPFPLGAAGRRTFVLRPGSWQLLVSSPEHGLQQRALDIPDRDTALQVVEVVLQPPEDGLVDLMVRVVDPDNQPVSGARVALDGAVYGTTTSGGELAIDGLREGPRTLSVGGERFVDIEEPLFLYAGLQEETVILGWQTGTTLVLARSPEGMVDDATARFAGGGRRTRAELDASGVGFFTLEPGMWQALVSSPSWGAQQHGLAIPEGSRSLHVVDALLNPGEAGAGQLTVEIVDPDGDPVRGAALTLDGIELGATSSQGTVGLVDLTLGERTLGVRAPAFAPQVQPVVVGAEPRTERVVLDWGVGALRVEARAAGEPVTDGTVRLGGPRFLPASPLDRAGRRLLAVEPGLWQVLVSSPSLGLHQERVAVPETPGLTTVVIDLVPPAGSLAQVLVRVQDPDGEPVRGAVVDLEGVEPSLTGEGGLALIGDLDPGERSMSVTADRFEPVLMPSMRLDAGPNERIITLPWTPQPVRVRVEDADGQPIVGATVSFDGPAPAPATRTGADGVAQVALRPGQWRVLAATDRLGTRAAELTLQSTGQERSITLRLTPAQVELAEGLVALKDRIYFDTGRSEIRDQSDALLDEIAALLLAHPEIVRVEVGGHTDPIGGVAFNMELSRRRAASVVAALVARGVAPERLTPRGYGPTRPRASNDSPHGRALNRRVEFRPEAP